MLVLRRKVGESIVIKNKTEEGYALSVSRIEIELYKVNSEYIVIIIIKKGITYYRKMVKGVVNKIDSNVYLEYYRKSGYGAATLAFIAPRSINIVRKEIEE